MKVSQRYAARDRWGWLRKAWQRLEFAVHPAPAAKRQPILLLCGHVWFQILVAACKLDLFSFLSAHPDRTPDEIANRLRIPQGSVRMLLQACVPLGLLEVSSKAGRYRNSRWAESQLVSGKPGNCLAVLDAYHALWYQPFFHLTESLRLGTNSGLACFPGDGRSLYERLSDRPELEKIFHAWMDALSEAGIPAPATAALRDKRHLLDIGGGAGANAIRVAREYPNLQVTILDMPSVCELAAERIREANMSSRISVLPGNFIEDPLPRNIDAIMCAQIFPIYSEETNEKLVRRSADSLPAGGTLIVFNGVSNDDGVGPLSAAAHSLYFQVLATGEGIVYPPKSYEPWFREAGFQSLEIVYESSQATFIGTK